MLQSNASSHGKCLEMLSLELERQFEATKALGWSLLDLKTTASELPLSNPWRSLLPTTATMDERRAQIPQKI
jgi:hypothetical protein